MSTPAQKERETELVLREAQRALERAVELMLSEARTGRLLTRATPEIQALEAAHFVVATARHALRQLAAGEPVPLPSPTHVFSPGADGICRGCGKAWAGGHPPTKAPPIVLDDDHDGGT